MRGSLASTRAWVSSLIGRWVSSGENVAFARPARKLQYLLQLRLHFVAGVTQQKFSELSK